MFDVRFGSKADIGGSICDVRYTPKSGHGSERIAGARSAVTGRTPAATGILTVRASRASTDHRYDHRNVCRVLSGGRVGGPLRVFWAVMAVYAVNRKADIERGVDPPIIRALEVLRAGTEP